MTEISDEAREVLAACTPLPPMCVQYLDLETLGTEADLDEIVEHFTEVFVEYIGDDRSKDPLDSAIELVEKFDAVTINLMTTSLKRELISFSVLQKVRANALTGVRARQYLLMQIAISGLEAKSGSYRQFMGLYEMSGDATNGDAFEISIETDDQYRKHAACLRYAVMVTNGLDMREGEALFLRRSDDDLVIPPKVHQLLWENPERSDYIARIVIERKAQEPEVIKQLLDGSIRPPLGSGVL